MDKEDEAEKIEIRHTKGQNWHSCRSSANILSIISVSYPEKGECADPVNEDAILEGEGGGCDPGPR